MRNPFENLTEDQQKACAMIIAGKQNRHLGVRVPDYNWMPGGGLFSPENTHQAEYRYRKWKERCERKGIDYEACLAILNDELSFREIDQCNRQRKGTAQREFIEALDEFWNR